jgi:hypothetical protein
MSSSSSVDSSASTASSPSEATDTQAVECRVCGKQFDDMAEMQRHMLTEHIQKGDLPNDEH